MQLGTLLRVAVHCTISCGNMDSEKGYEEEPNALPHSEKGCSIDERLDYST
jgi:hypothetical protein